MAMALKAKQHVPAEGKRSRFASFNGKVQEYAAAVIDPQDPSYHRACNVADLVGRNQNAQDQVSAVMGADAGIVLTQPSFDDFF